MNPFSGHARPHRFYFPAAWSSPTASISRHQEPQSRLPPKVMVIQGRYYLVRTTQNRTHFLQLYTGIYALWLKRPVFISLGTAKKRNRMTINSIKYISEVMFDYTEIIIIIIKKQTKKQSSFRFLLDFLKTCGASIDSCLRECLSKQQLQLKMVNKKEEQFEKQPLIDCPTCR